MDEMHRLSYGEGRAACMLSELVALPYLHVFTMSQPSEPCSSGVFKEASLHRHD